MAKNSVLRLVLVFALAGTLLSTGHERDDCHGDVEALIQKCKNYVEKEGPRVSPSVQCCHVVKHVDVPCACKYVTPRIEEIISMEKAVYVAKKCGRPLKHGYKCGSKPVALQAINH
ncbi:Protease inhibitor/seed storage/lipid transfer family protein [Cocos nucifera]|nr:Protease inhibitor/seed storage/lipid transfer family protein [Cocos nucifera]EHA8589802.1 Protease inhibitor/seed storage/lipid transfer family protein [Cocos nucifera]